MGSSNAIEYAAFQRCMDFLLGNGLPISTFVSDRHASITKHMREELTNITHYFDIWHLKKSKSRVAFDFLLVGIGVNWQGDRGTCSLVL